MSDIKAVIFDLDGVITNTAELQYETWKKIGKEIGIEINKKFNDSIKGVSRMDSLEGVLEYGGKEDEFSKKEKEDLCEKKNEEYQDLIDEIKPKDKFPGIEKLMKEIKKEGIKIAIGSSSSNAPKVLKNLKLDKYVDYIVNPQEVKEGKPAPDIFLKAAEMLRAKPEECVVIEDSESGIEAIKRAKMFAVGIGKQKNHKEADIHYKDTSKLCLKEIKQRYNKRMN